MRRCTRRRPPIPGATSNLGVEDTSAAAASGVRIELVGPPKPVNLIVGKPGVGAQSSYVRRAGEAQSWLVNATSRRPRRPMSGSQETSSMSLPTASSRRQSPRQKRSRTPPRRTHARTRTSRSTGLPKGKELSSPSAANSFATALTSVTLANVQPAKVPATSEPASHATYKTFDGLVTEIDGWTRDDKHYIALKTSFDSAQAERFKLAATPAETPAEGSPRQRLRKRRRSPRHRTFRSRSRRSTPKSAAGSTRSRTTSTKPSSSRWMSCCRSNAEVSRLTSPLRHHDARAFGLITRVPSARQ